MCTMPIERKRVASWIAAYLGAFSYTENGLYCKGLRKIISNKKKSPLDACHIAELQEAHGNSLQNDKKK